MSINLKPLSSVSYINSSQPEETLLSTELCISVEALMLRFYSLLISASPACFRGGGEKKQMLDTEIALFYTSSISLLPLHFRLSTNTFQ